MFSVVLKCPEDRADFWAVTSTKRKKVLAISSGGGHWVQLLRLRSAFEGCDLVFATVSEMYRQDVEGARFHAIPDATRWNKLGLIKLGWRILTIMLRERPDVVVTTGAAPGYLAILVGRVFRSKTVWIDSIANVDCLSLSGEKAGAHSDLWLTQWPHLAGNGGPVFKGAVL